MPRKSNPKPASKPERKPSHNRLNLYWVATRDHDDDWFIFAATAKGAARCHLDFNDYEDTVAKAELILSNLSEPECPTCGRSYSERRDCKESFHVGWRAEVDELVMLGFKDESTDPYGRRVVRLKRRTFKEGNLDSENRRNVPRNIKHRKEMADKAKIALQAFDPFDRRNRNQ